MITNPKRSPKSKIPNLQPSPKDIFLAERVRQAKHGFNLSMAFTVGSGLVTVIGLSLLLTGRISPSAYATTAGGAVSTVVSGRLSREANDRLDKMMKEQDDESPK